MGTRSSPCAVGTKSLAVRGRGRRDMKLYCRYWVVATPHVSVISSC